MATPFRQLESVTSYTADGVTTAWNFSFSSGYLDKAHVKAYQLSPLGARTDIPVTLSMFAGAYQITITPAVPAGYELTIYRDTPTAAPLVDFTDAAAFTEVALDTVVKQATFSAAETQDALSVASARIDQIGSFAQGAQDAQTAANASKLAAAQSAADAATSAGNALGSANAAATSAASVVATNLVHLAGAETITGVKTFSAQPVGITAASVGLGNVNNTSDASKPVSTAQQAALDQRRTRNVLHNGNFVINQRAVTGTVTLGAGAYGHDRWKAGAAGCTYTFAASGNGYIITISAGSLMQVVEDKNVEGGVFVLANRGTAQARIAVNGAATSGAYAAATVAAPLASASATANQTMTVEFSTGTIDRVQLEAGATASGFERRDYGAELGLCLRFFWAPNSSFTVQQHASTGQNGFHSVIFPVPMRVAPTAVTSWSALVNASPNSLRVAGPVGAEASISVNVAPGVFSGVITYTSFTADL